MLFVASCQVFDVETPVSPASGGGCSPLLLLPCRACSGEAHDCIVGECARPTSSLATGEKGLGPLEAIRVFCCKGNMSAVDFFLVGVQTFFLWGFGDLKHVCPNSDPPSQNLRW